MLCGLGRGLDETGRLNAEGVDSAPGQSRALRAPGASAWACAASIVLATAAVRDASNGAEFAAEVERRSGVPVRILSGAEEGGSPRSASSPGIPDADGVVGDLGGGSVELVGLDNGRARPVATLPIGPLRLGEAALGDHEQARDIDRPASAKACPGSAIVRGRNFYAVGGAWRALARIHMEQTGYPLHIIQDYRIDRAPGARICWVMSRLGRARWRRSPVSAQAPRTLPFAALLLERLLRIARPEAIVFSAFGLREGHLFSQLSPAQREPDPLMAAASELPIAMRASGRWAMLLDQLDGAAVRGRDAPSSSACARPRAASATSPGATIPIIAPNSRFDQHPASAGRRHRPRAARLRRRRRCRALWRPRTDRSMQPALRMMDEAATSARARLGLALRLAYSLSGAHAEAAGAAARCA